MGQIEIYEILKSRRESGDHSFFSATDVRRMLKDAQKPSGRSVYVQIPKLEADGYLEAKFEGSRKSCTWRRVFRLKSDYLDTKKEADIQKEPLILLDKTGESQVADLPKEAF